MRTQQNWHELFSLYYLGGTVYAKPFDVSSIPKADSLGYYHFFSLLDLDLLLNVFESLMQQGKVHSTIYSFLKLGGVGLSGSLVLFLVEVFLSFIFLCIS